MRQSRDGGPLTGTCYYWCESPQIESMILAIGPNLIKKGQLNVCPFDTGLTGELDWRFVISNSLYFIILFRAGKCWILKFECRKSSE